MSKRQVYYITGSPESVSEQTEDGKPVEVWTLRQSRGIKIGFWAVSSEAPGTGLPKTLRFVDGKLESFDASGTSGLKLDD